MTKYYIRLMFLLSAVVGLIAIVGSLLPRGYSFTSEVEIAAPAEKIFPRINTLRRWQEWSQQWNPEKIESLTIDYNGQTAGVGAAQEWSDIRGTGKLWITKSEPVESLEYKMLFSNFPEMDSQIVLESAGEKTIVRWSSQGKLPGGPFYGFLGAFFSQQMQAEYDKSLSNLKTIIESEK